MQVGDWSDRAGQPGRRRGTRGGTSPLAGTSREARLCGDSLGEGEKIKTTTGESVGVYRVLCCYSVAMPWLIDRRIDYVRVFWATRIVVWVSGVGR